MRNNKSIGGYFELETKGEISSFHYDAIELNTARNALEYILEARAIKKIYLPYFTCDVLLEPIEKLQLPFEFYSIDEQLEPIFEFSTLTKDDAFLYTNYFGLKDFYIEKLSILCKCLIVDNAQAFYAKPNKGVPTFYSARKFFGVSDGAYLYCNEKLNTYFDKDNSYDRMSHLLIRKDGHTEAGYKDFVVNDKSLDNQPIKTMSLITTSILGAIDYKSIASKRIENFSLLDKILKETNKLSLKLKVGSVPMVYPYWSEDKNLRKRLLDNKIYTATYWPNVKRWSDKNSLEYILTDEVVYLPIDQRYSINDMKKILKNVCGTN